MGTRAWLGSLNFSTPYGLYPYGSLWSMPKACMQIVAKDCWLPPLQSKHQHPQSEFLWVPQLTLCQPGPRSRKDRTTHTGLPIHTRLPSNDTFWTRHPCTSPALAMANNHWSSQTGRAHQRTLQHLKSPHPIHPLSPIESCCAAMLFLVVRKAARGPGKWWPWYLPCQKANGPAAAPHPPGTLKLVGQKIGWQLSEQCRSTWDPQLGWQLIVILARACIHISKFNAPLLLLQVFALGSSEAN